MEVHVLGKKEFDMLMLRNNINDDNVDDRDKIMLISIVDTDIWNDGREHYFKENHENVFNLEFDDVEHDGEPSPTNWNKGTKAFSEQQAKELFEFINKNRDKTSCVVHCMAGISRSGAVGTFINGYCGGDWDFFKRMNPQISPNARVERMLNQARYDSQESENRLQE